MAFIRKEEIKTIRENLKKAFPKIKFSVVNDNGSTVSVSIMKSEYDFSEILGERDDASLNPYYPEHYGKFENLFSDIIKIMKGDNWYSKPYSHDIAYYLHLNIGKWNKPYQMA